MSDGVNPLGPLGPYQSIIGKVQKLVEAYQFFSNVDKAGHVVLEENVKKTTDEETGVVITETITKEKYDPRKAEEKASSAIIATKLGEAAQVYAEIIQEIMKLIGANYSKSPGDEFVINMGDNGPIEDDQLDSGLLSKILGGITGQQPSNPLHRIAGELGVGVNELEALLKKLVNEKKESEKAELDGILKHVRGDSSSDILAGVKAFVEDKGSTDSAASIEEIVKKYGGFDNLIEKLQRLQSNKKEKAEFDQVLQEKNNIIEEARKILEADLSKSKNQIVALSEALTNIAEGDAGKVKDILARQGGIDPLLKALNEPV